jgi:molecular chaperone DnaK (HSP70)
MADSVAAGIDLGTTFSVIAVVDANGVPKAIPNAEGEETTPSVVHVHADGTFTVGRAALTYPEDTARIFKRFMGSPRFFPLAGRNYSAEQLSAEVLRKLVTDASQRLGAPIREVVISVPAYFGQMERDATRRAGELAGLTVLQMINEPTAAATVYTQHHQLGHGYLLIFDLGGGTFDITLLEVTDQGPYVKRTGGSIHLGGQDFNDTFVNMLAERYRSTHSQDILGDARVALDREMEAAKIALSTAPSAVVSVAATGGPTMPVTLSREEFESGIAGYLIQIQTIIETLLDRANLSPIDIQKVLLVGGSSHIPAVRGLLQEMFGQTPDESLNPDLAVAWGAALVAASLRTGGLVQATGGLRIMDTVSHAVGVKALEAAGNRYMLDAVLPHGFLLGKWSEPRSYRPERAGDSLIGVEIFQGDTVDLAGCTKIGYLPVPLPTGSGPVNTHISVWMQLDNSGLLQVQVAINNEQPHRAEFRL